MKLTWPATSDQMKAAGYEYDNESFCRGCGNVIEWWVTPSGKKMPVSVVRTATVNKASGDVREPHFATCDRVNQFRK